MKTTEEILKYVKSLKRKNLQFLKEAYKPSPHGRLPERSVIILNTRIGVYSDLVDFIKGEDENN